MVVRFTSTEHATNAYHHYLKYTMWCDELNKQLHVVKFVSDLRHVSIFLWVLLYVKTACQAISEILVKMALNTHNPNTQIMIYL